MSHSEHLATVMVNCLIDAVNNGTDLIPVVADSTSTAKIKPFMEKFPERLVNVGIAEQLMVGTAAGLALGGKVAVTCNAAPFLISRANEQVKVDVCYNNTNVKLFGLNAGASYGPLASTHHSTDDVAVMRGFGNIEIYAPACPLEARQIIDYAIQKIGPVYIRLDGKALPVLHGKDYCFKPGHIDVLKTGGKIALVAMGSAVHEAVEAAQRLADNNVEVTVISISSIRPCDTDALAKALAGKTQIITVEEHNVNGGVGSLVSEVVAEHGLAIKVERRGISNGGYAIAADRASTRKDLGIDANSLVSAVTEKLA